MPTIYKTIAEKIKELRVSRPGLSQERLAEAIGTAPNTISRWETATYKPSIGDLEKLSRYFKVPITFFFPHVETDAKAQALLSATGDLDEEDVDEIVRYANFRRARKHIKDQRKKR
jgi:transcriptional regulator with XRE-family HTH domain